MTKTDSVELILGVAFAALYISTIIDNDRLVIIINDNHVFDYFYSSAKLELKR